MKFRVRSIGVQILIIVFCAFTVSRVFTAVFSGSNLRAIVDNGQEQLYNEKIEVIIKELLHQNELWEKIADSDLSLEDVQLGALDLIRDIYYTDDPIVFPFIVTKDNTVIIHPHKKEGEKISFGQLTNCPQCDRQYVTLERCCGKGDVWCISGYFEPWGWYIVYAVPLDEKYKDFDSYMEKMKISTFVIAGILLVSLSLIMMHFTRPIVRLSEISKQIAEDKWDQPIDIHQKNEIGTLAISFDHMRNAVRDQIHSLNQEITEREKAENEAVRLENFLTNMIDAMPSTIICVNNELAVIRLNQTAAQHMGCTILDAYGRKFGDLFPYLSRFIEHIERTIRDASVFKEKHINCNIDGEQQYFNLYIYPLTTEDVPGAVIRIDDVSREYQLEQQLYQREKLESVGLLAGGISHDFNNMLAGIMGAAEIIRLHLTGNEKALKFNQTILETCEQASGLIENLLAFSSEHPMEIAMVDIHYIAKDALLLLSHTIDRRINIQSNFDADDSKMMGDSAQLESLFINLGINASHALPDGGIISVNTSNIYMDKKECSQSSFDLEPGPYILIEFKDTGTGIEKKDLAKIFEPFFTTKDQGEGTGLGLASVYGTVCQHKGSINVYSEKRDGSNFRILFPLVSLQHNPTYTKNLIDDEIVTGTGTILVIDDEEFVREMTQEMLETLGYTVLSAANGLDGLDLYREKKAQIDLILLDMMMPDMRGDECFRLIREKNPEEKVILASGYIPEEDFAWLKAGGVSGFLTKPYSRATLSRMIHTILH